MSLNLPLVAGAFCALALASSNVCAEETASSTHASGMRVYVDPETGRLVSAPVTEQQRAAAAAQGHFSQDASKIVETTAADGSRMYVLNGQFELALGAELATDGTLRLGCTDADHATLADDGHAQLHAAPAADER